MTTHVLKTLPTYFAAVASGDKTFEVRLDDRGYQAGHAVTLREFDVDVRCECRHHRNRCIDSCPRYTGRTITALIGYVLASTPRRGSVEGFNGRGYVVFSLCRIDVHEGQPASPRQYLNDLGITPTLSTPTPADLDRRVSTGGHQ